MPIRQRSDFSDFMIRLFRLALCLYSQHTINSIYQKTDNSASHAVDLLHLKIDSKTRASDFSDFTIRLFRLTGAGEGSDDRDMERIQPQEKALHHFGMNFVGSIEDPAGKIRVFSFDKIQNHPANMQRSF